ncbi:MAG TPA: hypothetical protein VGI10_01415 [Polyangiaceae bacterium]
MGRVRCLALVAACALQSSLGRAAPGEAARLQYARTEAAQGCPDAAALKAAVAARLGYDPFFPAARQTVVVEIVAEETKLSARMSLVDANGIIRGSRELSDPARNCEELLASLALAISIALDPNAALADDTDPMPPPRPPEQAAAPARDGQSSESRAEKIEPETQEPADRKESGRPPLGTQDPYAIGARLGAAVSLGSAPAPAFGGRFGARVRKSWFQVVGEFREDLPARRNASAGGSVETALTAGSVSPCFVGGFWLACGLITVGQLRANGRAVEVPQSRRTLYAASGARLELRALLGARWNVLANADLLATLTPLSLRLHGTDVWSSSKAVFAMGVSAEFEIP